MTKTRHADPEFVVCIRNEGYGASLEIRKLYRTIADASASEHHQLRVVDESGEDYLYPANYFVPIELPQAIEKAILRAS